VLLPSDTRRKPITFRDPSFILIMYIKESVRTSQETQRLHNEDQPVNVI
jgi:hypothetical protein